MRILVLFLFTTINILAQSIENGAKIFEVNCATCHNFKQDGIGPQLGGLKGVVDEKYLFDFISSPKAMVDAKISRAYEKFRKFKVMMADYNYLPENEIRDLVAFIIEKPAPKIKTANGKKVLENPIAAKIKMVEAPLKLKKVMTFPFTNEVQPRTRITKMGSHPITKEMMVADLQGQLYIIDKNYKPEIFFNAKDHFKNFINKAGLAVGLGSFAFHPDFAKNHLFYTSHTEPKNSAKADFGYNDTIPIKMQWVLNEWKLDNPASRELKGTFRELMRVNVVGQIHGMQEIVFNPYAKHKSADYGLLYVCIGDGGAVEDGFPHIPKGRNQIWGKVLRIDPLGKNSKNAAYGIPVTNPYFGKKGLPEIYAEGFRNPNRISWTKSGKALVSNIGQHQIESLYWLKPGKNYGWPYREGTFAIDTAITINELYALPKNDANYGYTYPIAQFDHDEGNAIMGGFEYSGVDIPLLKGKYIFGEVVRGRVFYINISEILEGKQAKIHEFPLKIDGKLTTLKETTQQNKVDFRIGHDASGEMFIFTKADGVMYKIVK